MSHSDTQELVSRYYAAFNRGDWETMLALLHEDVAHDLNQGPRECGSETFRGFLARMNRCYREQLAEDEEVVQSEQKRLELAQLRYEGGVASYSDVLDAQRYLFSAQLSAVQTRNNLLNASVQLYKSLGGGH